MQFKLVGNLSKAVESSNTTPLIAAEVKPVEKAAPTIFFATSGGTFGGVSLDKVESSAPVVQKPLFGASSAKEPMFKPIGGG